MIAVAVILSQLYSIVTGAGRGRRLRQTNETKKKVGLVFLFPTQPWVNLLYPSPVHSAQRALVCGSHSRFRQSTVY